MIKGCVSLTGPGEPRWAGGPSPERIRRIHILTTKIADQQYFRLNGSWRKLRTAEHFAILNRMVDPPIDDRDFV